MPVHDPLTDDRFAAIVAELRAAETPTPTELVERVGRQQAHWARPATARPPRRRLRRLVAPAVVGLALVAGGVFVAGRSGGISSTTGEEAAAPAQPVAAMTAAAASDTGAPAASIQNSAQPAAGTVASGGADGAATYADGAATRGRIATESAASETLKAPDVPQTADPTRLQHQSASLRVALPTGEDVGQATTAVTSAVVALGGHVTAVQYSSENASAGAQITAKVPIDRAQEAINRFSSLGRLAASQIQIEDLQGEADTLEQRIARFELQIARYTAQLAGTDLTTLRRAELEVRRGRARVALADTRARSTKLERKAAMADFEIALITERKRKVVAPGDTGLDAGDGWGVLRDAAGPAAYVAVVVAPLVALLIAALVGRRLWRRRAERRLLASA